MIKFTEYYEPKESGNNRLDPITYTTEVSEKVKAYHEFTNLNTQIILLIVNQTDMKVATDIAISWHEDVVELAKVFYGVTKVTDQINNNLRILIEDVVNGRLDQIERTYITTFSNVAKFKR